MSGSLEINDDARANAVETALGHAFTDRTLLRRACTHASRIDSQAGAARRLAEANERLEFLGDALLGAALCAAFYALYPDANEGQLSRLKAQLASRQTLARLFDRVGLAAHCLVGAQMQTPWPDSVKANLMEALLGAIFIDAGWPAVAAAVERIFADALANRADAEDAKTRLQAWSLDRHGKLPDYTSERSGGTDHAPEFTATVTVGESSASGSGTSRRRAEAAAAEALWKLLEA